MKKTILLTGATDGIGLATAQLFAELGHNLIIHGRNTEKLQSVVFLLSAIPNVGDVKSYLANLSNISQVISFIDLIKNNHKVIDVIINNAGVFKTNSPVTDKGLDVRFMVNTITPYFITQTLLPLLPNSGRIINLSSAAQAPVDINALKGGKTLSDMEAYAQSKLAITMWSHSLAQELAKDDRNITVVAVNPGSLLASKMVKEGFGIVGNDINIGANILKCMSLDNDIVEHSGEYFDNDSGQFTSAHVDANSDEKCDEIVRAIENVLAMTH